ncbi:sensor histidine kinase [Microbacterium marinilacus]|uniref:sensor histidine kinase n=1 Tax=Microbacterium marinilacus TaxID=415209 RepID=UPI001C8E4074|nr:ATP-binding protein [Microbacterium marinilacus]MBY0689269.1 DUF4118 domain-containing protein [Microbacterium marinilacus]
MPRFAMLPLRRQLAAALAAALLLSIATATLAPFGGDETFVVAALVYQLIVVIAAVLGGLLVAVGGAVAAGALLNFFFAAPVHSVAIADGAHLVAIVVFVVVGVIVGLVVGQSEARLSLAQQTAAAESRALAAQEADRVKTALLTAVGHDLRTPLAAASAAATSLAAQDVEWTPAQRAELVDAQIAALRRLERLVDDLLDTSRLDAGVLPVVPEAMRVEDAASLALDELGADADGVAMTADARVPDALADPVLVQRIVANLVGNALRHAGGAVGVRIAPVGAKPDAVELAVVDHGPGIPPDLREAAFRPFQRLDDRGTGVGLGLALARGFAQAMGGDLVAQDTPGGGLTCRLRLPIAPGTTAPGSAPGAREPSA